MEVKCIGSENKVRFVNCTDTDNNWTFISCYRYNRYNSTYVFSQLAILLLFDFPPYNCCVESRAQDKGTVRMLVFTNIKER